MVVIYTICSVLYIRLLFIISYHRFASFHIHFISGICFLSRTFTLSNAFSVRAWRLAHIPFVLVFTPYSKDGYLISGVIIVDPTYIAQVPNLILAAVFGE